MKYLVYTDDFKAALEKVTKCIKKSVVPICESVLVEFVDRHCYLKAYNIEQYIRTKIDVANGSDTGSFILQDVKSILKAMKYFSDTYIEFDMIENKLSVKCGSKKFESVYNYQASDFPETPTCANTNTYKYDSKKLSERFNLVKYAVCKDAVRPILTGIHFDSINILSCDGYRIALNKDYDMSVCNPFTVPVESMKLFTSVLNGDIEIFTDHKYIVVKDKNTEVGSKLLDGDFANYKSIVESNGEDIKLDVKNFTNELKYLREFTEDIYNSVAWCDDKMETVSSTGRYSTSINADIKTGCIIGFNCEYMLDALTQFKDVVNIAIKNSTSPMHLSDGGSNIAIVLPVRSGIVEKCFVDEIAS